MNDRPALYPCPRKGCPWRGPDPDTCPMHGADDLTWDRERLLMPEHVVAKRHTSRRN